MEIKLFVKCAQLTHSFLLGRAGEEEEVWVATGQRGMKVKG